MLTYILKELQKRGYITKTPDGWKYGENGNQLELNTLQDSITGSQNNKEE